MENHVHLKNKIIEEYWFKKLNCVFVKEILPEYKHIDRSSEAEKSIYDILIPEETTCMLNQISKGSDTGRLILLLSGLAGLIYRYTGDGEICIGTTSLSSKDGKTGSILFIKSHVEENDTWVDLIEQMKVEVSHTFNHQPFSIEDFSLKFSSIYGRKLDNLWKVAFIDEGLQTITKDVQNFSLVIKLVRIPECLILRFEYDPEVYSQVSIKYFAENLLFYLGRLQENFKTIFDYGLNLVSPKERQFLIEEMNQTALDIKPVQFLHELFVKQVERMQNKIAIVESGRSISYRELNDKSNILASILINYGVKPDSIIGIVTQPTIEIIVAITAVLKAGGAYCPIDPEFPNYRVQQIFSDSGIELLLASQEYFDAYSFEGTIINISKLELYSSEKTNAVSSLKPENLAYVMYTSGSTGTPKGVMIEHKSIVNQISGLMKIYNFSESLRHVLMAPFSFDPSVQQVYLPLATGGTVYLISKEIKTNPDLFWKLIREEQINVINTVPSLMEVLLEQFRDITHVFRYMILAGEVFTGDLARRLREKLKIDYLINIYGPTEATINTTLYECKPIESCLSIPIGKPLPNYQVYILDQKHRLVPFGVVGELYITGVGLARGYINNPDVTNERFIPDPFNESGKKLYKTGDLVRWLPDGNLEFIGRTDRQVKTRGMRVELGEIELALTRSLWIKEAVVIKHESEIGMAELVAFYTLRKFDGSDNKPVDNEMLKMFLREHLPENMIPTHFICLESMPITDNGKINMKALPTDSIYNISYKEHVAPRNDTENKLMSIWENVLGKTGFGTNDSFFDVGGNSLSIIRLQSRINHAFRTELSVSQLFAHHTISQLAEALKNDVEGISFLNNVEDRIISGNNGSDSEKGNEVAVIGMACRFPLADGCEDFWDNLCCEVDAIREIPKRRMQDISIQAGESSFKKAAYLESIDGFDTRYFHIPPNEATIMDPQQRLFLQTVCKAIQDAGYSEKKIYGAKIGVYVGANKSRYMDILPEIEPHAIPGNLSSLVAGRVSYVYNLSGPSVVIDTACSSSLLAVHYAVNGLLTGDCDMAVAGGVNIYMSMVDENLYDMGIASPDGRAKTFDVAANGTGGGEGVGAVLLKPLKQAIKDGDNIYAVIKGSAVNSDGRSNGITAPNLTAQARAIEEAWERAGIDPETISYIEAHGTGTKLGDPIEIEGITNAFRRFTKRNQFCAIGSVKTNIGHLDTAAGIAGFIKTVLSIYNGQIPASLHFTEPNNHIDFMKSPVYVNTFLFPWQPECGIRRAGVSSFGLSGTNCHLVLEEYPMRQSDDVIRTELLFTLSACSVDALYNYIGDFVTYLRKTKESLIDICYCTNISRSDYTYRVAILVNSVSELQQKLEFIRLWYNSEREPDIWEKEAIYFKLESNTERYGQKYLVEKNAPLKKIIDAYIMGVELDWAEYYIGQDLKRVHLPTYPFEEKRYWPKHIIKEKLSDGIDLDICIETGNNDLWKISETVFRLGERLLNEGNFTQRDDYKEAVGTFAVQHIIKFFMHFNTLNNYGMTYSETELFNEIGVIPKYGRLFHFMLQLLANNGIIHIENSEITLASNILTADTEVLLAKYCKMYPEFDGTFRVLEYCFKHYPDVLTGKKSPLSVLFPDGTSNFLSTFTNKGRTLGDLCEMIGIEAIKQYILTHVCKGKVLKVLEVGAGSGTIAKAIFPEIKNKSVEYFYTDIGKAILFEAQKKFSHYQFVRYKIFNIEEDPFPQGFSYGEFDIIIGLNVLHATSSLRNTLSQLKKTLAPDGIMFIIEKVKNETAENLVWGMTEGWWLYKDQDLRVDSPLLSAPKWEMLLKDLNFYQVCSFPNSLEVRTKAETALIMGRMGGGDFNRLGDLLYRVDWVAKELNSTENSIPKGDWIIFIDNLGIGDELVKMLRVAGDDAVTVEMGEGFRRIGNKGYLINPADGNDYILLLNEMLQSKKQIAGFIHLWTCTAEKKASTIKNIDERLQTGVYSLYYLIKAMLNYSFNNVIEVRIVSNYALRLHDDKNILPEKSPIFGLAKVIPQEHPKIQCFGIDADTESYTPEEVADIILNELRGNKTDSLVAIRNKRFVQQLTRLKPNSIPQRNITIREQGVYIIVGGAGGLGLEVSRYLSKKNRVILIIINRTPLPDKSQWLDWLRNSFGEFDYDKTRYKLENFIEMEKNGSQIYYYTGDVADINQMQYILDDVHNKFGHVNGVIHCAAASGETSKPLAVQTVESFRKVLLPKIQGSIVLDTVLSEENLDFFVLYSSVASLWGGASGGDYAAANFFLDSFSAYRNLFGKNTLAINWYAWEGLTGPGCMGYMTSEEALDAFFSCLTYQIDQVAIGKFDFEVLAEWVPMMKIQLDEDIFSTDIQSSSQYDGDSIPQQKEPVVKVILKGKASALYSEQELIIAQIWADVLGYEEIDVNANFFDIGGDSLLILKILSQLNDKFDCELDAGDLFSYGTVAQLAEFIASKSISDEKIETKALNYLNFQEDENEDYLRKLIKDVKEERVSVNEAMKGFVNHEG